MKKDIIAGLISATILAVLMPACIAILYGLTISIIYLQMPMVYFSGLLERIDMQLIAYLFSVWIMIFLSFGVYPSIVRSEYK